MLDWTELDSIRLYTPMLFMHKCIQAKSIQTESHSKPRAELSGRFFRNTNSKNTNEMKIKIKVFDNFLHGNDSKSQ